MQIDRLQLAYPAPVRELQGMIRTSGEGAKASAIVSTTHGYIVTVRGTGERWLCSAAGVACIVPGEELPPVQPPPMPGKAVKR